MTPRPDLSATPLPDDIVGLLEGVCTTRAIRRYTDEVVPSEALRAMLFAATRAPSGSNRQPFRFVVLTDGPAASRARDLLGGAARRMWGRKQDADGYTGVPADTPKARMAATMHRYVHQFGSSPVIVLPCFVRYRDPTPTEGASVYPACQNLLLAARALGYGGVLTTLQQMVDSELHEVLGIPDEVFIAATITIGRPEGSHGPVRRRPLGEMVYEGAWGETADWAVDPPGTGHTAAGPPRRDAATAPQRSSTSGS